ncbi:DUF7260 family protein [Halonotius pteroides]|uniref:DUF7260 family protein n=1 Tax=Halonotius pteroides TaxID=268735 RepID=UPI00105863B7|nr:hypothetical protein [Halonotius pteroides]
MSLSAIPNTRGQISSAIDILLTENNQVTEEIRAFEQFKKQVLNISINTASRNSIGEFSYEQKPTVDATTRIRTAYCETVMSVSHYDAEYGDTYASSISEEFGSDIATALTESSNLTRILKSALINQIENAIESRKQLRKTIQLEQDSIKSSYEELNDLANSLYNYSKIEFSHIDHNRLIEYKDKICNDLYVFDNIAIIRQQDINKIRKSMQTDRTTSDLYSYLYQSLSTTYPVLEMIGQLGLEYKKLKLEIKKEIII